MSRHDTFRAILYAEMRIVTNIEMLVRISGEKAECWGGLSNIMEANSSA
jgi:hypothetical protein